MGRNEHNQRSKREAFARNRAVFNRWKRGETIAELACDFGVSTTTIRNKIHRYKFQLVKRFGRATEPKVHIYYCDEFEEGPSGTPVLKEYPPIKILDIENFRAREYMARNLLCSNYSQPYQYALAHYKNLENHDANAAE